MHEKIGYDITKEELYRLELLVNDINIDLLVNKKDVFGEPAPGRRYKGNVWRNNSRAC